MGPRRIGRLRRAMCTAALVAVLLPTAIAEERREAPDPAACKPVAAALRKEFKTELRSKDAQVKRQLAATLLERAAAEKDAAARYVFLDQAILAAQGARDVRVALEGVARLSAAFEVPRAARANKALAAIAKGTKESGVLAEIAGASLDVAGDALAENDPAAATKAVGAARKHAKKIKMDGLVARAAELAKLVASFKRLSKAMTAARLVLAVSADDPAAHTAIGRFGCFGLNAWESGLEHLAKGDHPALKALAAAEAAAPTGPLAKQELAAQWWTAAEAEKDPLAAARMRARAAHHGLDEARAGQLTYITWNRSVALTTDFSEFGPANLALATIRTFIEDAKIDRDDPNWRTKLPRFPDVSFAPDVAYFWHLETNHGAMKLRFFPDTAPNHVANFLYLTELGFFDGLLFHRVITRFMAQGGCPKKDGTGNPGYFIDGEFGTLRKHDRGGLLSMANAGAGTDGSQFFITFVPYPSLDGKHTVFGELVDGQKTLDKLEAEGSQGGRPRSQLVIESARVTVR